MTLPAPQCNKVDEEQKLSIFHFLLSHTADVLKAQNTGDLCLPPLPPPPPPGGWGVFFLGNGGCLCDKGAISATRQFKAVQRNFGRQGARMAVINHGTCCKSESSTLDVNELR